MFDLEQQIQQWRQEMAGRLPGRNEAIDELESHLREATERAMLSGKPPQAAWELALAQLGSTDALATEFEKQPATSFYRWRPAQVMMALYGAFSLWLVWLWVFRLNVRQHDLLLALHVTSLTLGYTAAFALGAMAAWSILARAVFGWTARESAALCSAVLWWTVGALTLTVLGIVLGSFWAREHMGRFWGWDIREIAALAILLWYGLFFGLLSWRPRNEQSVMLLGQVGNVVIALCWFGPNLLHIDLHSYGLPSYSFLTTLVLAELALAGLTFVRPGQLRIARS